MGQVNGCALSWKITGRLDRNQRSFLLAHCSLTYLPFVGSNYFTSRFMNHEVCVFWQIINHFWESRGQISGLLIFDIRHV